jgi:trk system potassium uptake protein TrkH
MAWKEIRRLRWKKGLSPAQSIAIAFAVIILIGTVLLSLPAASRTGEAHGMVDALMAATSATCVTGLVPGDTFTMWSDFGQTVLLVLIELGGLGFMSMASLVILLLRKKVGLRQRMMMAQALSLDDMQSVWKLQKWVLGGSLLIQLTGAGILFLRFLPDQGVATALKWGVFHSVSAFCNAGFDLFGQLQPGASLMPFQNDPVVLLTLMGLIVVGGLGFFVWEEVVRLHSFKKFSVYTKLVLLTSGILILGGAALILALEWNNPNTLGPMQTGEKILNGFFQSVSLRTAGFASVDQALLTDSGKAVSMVLMFIGGSSGSTAGGLKTVTFVVLMLFILARIRGKRHVTVFRRTVPTDKVTDAMTLTSVMFLLALFGGIFICATSPVGLTNGMFESVSALATVGLTAGVTPLLSLPAKLLIIVFMYFGRVGVLTLSLGFLSGDKAQERFRYATTNLLIG